MIIFTNGLSADHWPKCLNTCCSENYWKEEKTFWKPNQCEWINYLSESHKILQILLMAHRPELLLLLSACLIEHPLEWKGFLRHMQRCLCIFFLVMMRMMGFFSDAEPRSVTCGLEHADNQLGFLFPESWSGHLWLFLALSLTWAQGCTSLYRHNSPAIGSLETLKSTYKCILKVQYKLHRFRCLWL